MKRGDARRRNARRSLQILLATMVLLQLVAAWRVAAAKRPTVDRPNPTPLPIAPDRDPPWRLTLLPGIGWKRAHAIVAWRSAGRPIDDWDALAEASGAPARTIRSLQTLPGIRLVWPSEPPSKTRAAGTLPR